MVNYNNATIYKIVPKDLDSKYCYIGSTVDFKKRKWQHKSICNNSNASGYNIPLYKHIRDNGGWDAFEMILIEFFSCETKLELHKRERQCKEIYNDNLGCEIPGRTKKEYYQDNKEKTLQRVKEYYQDNQEKIAEQMKEYYQNNKDKVRVYNKEYHENNKEILLQKKREYYQNNKETIYGKGKEKIECSICKCYIRKDNMTKHTKTKKHQSNL